MITETRECKGCSNEKPLDDFPTYRLHSGDLAWRWSCKTCFHSKRPSMSPSERRKATLRHLYKLDWETYQEMAKDGCEVCGTMDVLVVDHDHSCCPGKTSCGECVRGILCNRHNRAEGALQGNVAEALALAEYMMRTVK